MPRYRFTGPAEEDFPAPPIARRLHPGDEIETAEPVEHARLELVEEPADDAPPVAPRTRKTAAAQPASPPEE